MKKILAVLLAAMLVMSMSIMAFAADPIKGTVSGVKTTEYEEGEEIKLAGLKLSYKDSEGKDKELIFGTDTGTFGVVPATMGKDTTTVKVTYTSEDNSLVVEGSFAVTLKKPEDKTAIKVINPIGASYTVKDEKAESDFLSKLAITYTDKDGKETTVKWSGNEKDFEVTGFDVSTAKEITVTVNYKPAGKTDTVKVTIKDKDKAKIVVNQAKGVYKVGEPFDFDNLYIDYIDEDGNKIPLKYGEGAGVDIGVKGFNNSKVAEKVTVTVTYLGLEATYDIAVVEKDRLDKETIVKDLWEKKAALDANPNATIEDYVKGYTTIISQYMAADDLDDIVKYVKAQDEVQELVQDSSLYPDNWNEFVKIYTDYVPTGVNQALDIAARLGWDASDQDFVQDIIDLVKGAAESDKAAEDGTTANGGSTGSTSTDANPKTGSASAIAVFAVLSVAAAAAVVCTKKKED